MRTRSLPNHLPILVILAMATFLSTSCSRQPNPTPAGPAPAEGAATSLPNGDKGSNQAETDIPGTIEVRLVPSRAGARIRWREEWLGLATAYLEAGLADLEEVIPVVEGQRPSPGLAQAWATGRKSWTGTLDVASSGDDLSFSLELCGPDGTCRTAVATSPKQAPDQGLSGLLEEAAGILGADPGGEARSGWKLPLSRDPYAVLLTGRSAATWYGLLPPIPDERVGDRRRDPIARAVSVDPSLPLSQWILARRALAAAASCPGPGTRQERGRNDGCGPRGHLAQARAALEGASLSQPWRVIYRADGAGAWAVGSPEGQAGGRAGRSRKVDHSRAWDLVQALAPDQLRFLGGRVAALVADGEWDAATALLGKIPEGWEDDPGVIVSEVAIAEGKGAGPGYDQLLARWQLAARMDPEPIRRRIALRIREARYDEALAFSRSLEERGAATEAATLSMSLGLALGDFDLAASMAERLELEETAARIRARAALTREPAKVPKELERANEPVEWVARGAARLKAGDAADALFDADAALKASPWMPEALALRMEALEALGRRADAWKALKALQWADPSWPVKATAERLVEAQARNE